MLLPQLIVFGVIFIVAIYFRFFYTTAYKREKHYLLLGEKISSWLFTTSILGLIYLFMRYEGIVYLSARILLYLILLYFVIIGIRIFRFYQTEFIRLQQEHKQDQHKSHYMPKKRKKK